MYFRNTFDYDIALIVLTRDIVFSETAMPVCLPFKFENTVLTGKLVTLLGKFFASQPTTEPIFLFMVP